MILDLYIEECALPIFYHVHMVLNIGDNDMLYIMVSNIFNVAFIRRHNTHLSRIRTAVL